MATYSTNLALTLMATGEQSNTWGDTTNTNLGTLLEQAISGYVTQVITDGSSANTTITIPNGATGVARNMFIEMTGALTFSTTSLIVPANKKLYFIYNNTTGGFAVTVKVSGQTGVSVPNGKKMVLVSNGTDIVNAENYIASLSVGALTSGRVTYAGTAGLLQDSANLTFNGTTLTANTIGAFTLGGTVAGGGNQLNNVIIGTTTPLAGAFTTITGGGRLQLTALGSPPASGSGLELGGGSSPIIFSYNRTSSAYLPLDLTASAFGWSISGTSIGTFSSTGINGMAIGATTPSTGAFTTLSASGDVSANNGLSYITGVIAPSSAASGKVMELTVDSDRVDMGGTFRSTIISFDRTNTVYGDLNIQGLSVGIAPSGTIRGLFTSTGLAVTGTLSATGVLSTTNTVSGELAFVKTTNASGGYLAFYGNTSTLSGFLGSEIAVRSAGTVSNFAIRSAGDINICAGGGGIIGNFSSTGLAVTGTLSATGNITTNTSVGGVLSLQNTSVEKVYISGGASYNAFSLNQTGIGTTSTNLLFATSNVINMTLDTSGNLGLGGTPVNSGSTTALTIYNATAAALYLQNSTSGTTSSDGATLQLVGADLTITNRENGYIRFNTNNTERARIDSSGNLLVGTTVVSDISGAGVKINPVGTSNGQVSCVSAASTSGSYSYSMYSTGASAYRFYVDYSGTIHASSIVITSISDERLKENVRDLDIGLDAIMALKPRRFDWKEGKGQDKKDAAGFIAQEFENVFPECVSTSKAGGDGIEYKNINHETLIPTLVKAIQEQQAIITALTTRITALENK